MQNIIFSLVFVQSICFGFNTHLSNIRKISPNSGPIFKKLFHENFQIRCSIDNEAVNGDELKLEFTAPRWKMICYDADDGVFGLDTKDSNLGVEVVKVSISRAGGLGLNLVEYQRTDDRRYMTFVEEVISGSNAAQSGKIRPGDTICFAGNGPNLERTEGLGLAETLSAIQNASPNESKITLVLKRLVKRVPIKVTFINNNGDESVYDILAGSNLRSEMFRRNIQIYDTRTKRFDQPYLTGDCGGEGICGTCLVECQYGMNLLNNRDNVEELVTAKRPRNWRLSCRTIIGANNKKGEVKFRILPQKRWNDNEY